MSIRVTAHFDGACMPTNPGGWATYGWVARRGGRTVREDLGVVGVGPAMSNNVAEYAAALAALTWLLALPEPPRDIEMVGDSKLVVEQMSGRWAIRAGRYVPLHRRLRQLVDGAEPKVAWRHVPRERNAEADALSKRAYHERERLPRSPLAALLA